jgi:hypothetical protein
MKIRKECIAPQFGQHGSNICLCLAPLRHSVAILELKPTPRDLFSWCVSTPQRSTILVRCGQSPPLHCATAVWQHRHTPFRASPPGVRREAPKYSASFADQPEPPCPGARHSVARPCVSFGRSDATFSRLGKSSDFTRRDVSLPSQPSGQFQVSTKCIRHPHLVRRFTFRFKKLG